MITVIIADDQPAVREGLRMRLGLEADFKVMGAAGDGQEALEVVARVQPDIVIMDGLATARKLQALAPDCRVIMLTIHDDEAIRQRARRCISSGRIGVTYFLDELV